MLRKYLGAETTPEEEKELSNYFSSADVPEDLESFKQEFALFSSIRLLQLDNDFDERILGSIQNRKNSLHASWVNRTILIKAAACIFLLLTGFAAGMVSKGARDQQQNSEAINTLTDQVYQLRLLTTMTLIKQESVHDRLQALAIAGNIKAPDNQLLDQLLQLVEADDNLNIRLAALETLHPFLQLPGVKERLVRAVVKQSSVLMQMELIRVIRDLHDKKCLDELKPMLKAPGIDPELKDSLQQMIKTI